MTIAAVGVDERRAVGRELWRQGQGWARALDRDDPRRLDDLRRLARGDIEDEEGEGGMDAR